MSLLIGVKGKTASPDDAARDARKVRLRVELKEGGYPLTIQWEAKAMIQGEMITLGQVTCKPTYFEKSGRVAYVGSGGVQLMGMKDQSTVTTFLPFSVDKEASSVDGVKAAEAKANADLDAGETD